MSSSKKLRKTLKKNIKNTKSKKEDKKCIKVINKVINKINDSYNLKIEWKKTLYLKDIIESLKNNDKKIDFANVKNTTFLSPDGGILYLIDRNNGKHVILITEMKSQGYKKGKTVMGNAIERLGKNVIGFRTYMHNEYIFPFVCFGDGYDFKNDSYILDRVKTIAKFGNLNESNIGNKHDYYSDRGSYYFRVKNWSEREMIDILYNIAERSIFYYFSQFGKKFFN